MEISYWDDFELFPGTFQQYLDSIERELITHAIARNRWNRTSTAKTLNISFRAIRYRMEKLGVDGATQSKRNTPKGFSKVWPKLREAAFSLLGYKCQKCGASPKNGYKLHVDHVKPVRDYTALALALSNLQTLCDQCNIAKGARNETDWRDT